MWLKLLKHGTLQQSEPQSVNTSSADTSVSTLTAKSFLLDKDLMKFVPATFSIGMHHQLRSLIKHPDNMSKIFTCLIAEEETDAFPTGAWKAESHSLILKLLKLIGLYLLSGESLNTKELRNGGWEKPSKGWTFCRVKFCGERKRPFLMASVQRRNHGSKSFNKKPQLLSVMMSWKRPPRSILTILQQPSRLIISERSLLRFTELSDKQFFPITGFPSGTRQEP